MIETIIQKAREGGYDPTHGIQILKEAVWASGMPSNYVVMDANFWQGLEKACGWGENDVVTESAEGHEWTEYALRFHEINLTQGWREAVEWLADLIK